MRFLVDTNVIIEATLGNIQAREFFEKFNNLTLNISYITVGELVQGAKDKEDLRKIIKFTEDFEVNYGSYSISQNALNLTKEYCLSKGINILDSIIAATALEENFILVTENLKHFKFLPKLEVMNIASALKINLLY